MMVYSGSSSPTQAAVYLPSELWFETFTYLSGNDIIHFLSTSRIHRALATTDSIWHDLCSRYGVRDLTHFKLLDPNCTFYTVYTKLLYTYGPLLGLWASDNPFEGNILEFRIATEPDWVGIVGEVWRFQPTQLQGTPAHPEYHECIRIELFLSKQAAFHIDTTNVQFSWIVPGVDHDNLRRLTSPTDIIRLFTPHRLSFLVDNWNTNSTEAITVVHPPFPPPSLADRWFDPNRLPCLMEHEETVADTSDAEHARWIRALTPVIYVSTKPDRPPMPRSITVLAPPCTFSAYDDYCDLHSPVRDTFDDLRRVTALPSSESINGHYFPLPFPPTLWRDVQTRPSVDGWSPQSLEGVWLGSYQEDSTEVIYLKWDGEVGEIQAWKVTGNCCVPRGAMTWSFNTSRRIWASNGSGVDLLTELGFNIHSDADHSKMRIFEGVGVIADEGYLEDTRNKLGLTIAVASQNEIRILWTYEDDESETLTYRRYLERDVRNERVMGHGVRSTRENLNYGV